VQLVGSSLCQLLESLQQGVGKWETGGDEWDRLGLWQADSMAMSWLEKQRMPHLNKKVL